MTEDYRKISNTRCLPSSHIAYLRSLRDSGFSPKVIYDIGANFLHWTNEARDIWPDAYIILFEAYSPMRVLYEEYDHHIGVLSKVDNEFVKFYYNPQYPGGNSYYKENNDAVFPEDRYMIIHTERLDTVVRRLGLPLPDLVKIDVQGAEKDVFEGGVETIAHAQHLLMKSLKTQYNIGAPLVQDVIPFMEMHGWKCIAPLFSDNGPDGNYGYQRADLYSQRNPTICLNMIVKNESHIIAKTLEMLCKKIHFDYWVICDTGSSDDTPIIIQDFFRTRGIRGELHHDEWKNFAYNRTLALERAFQKTDLLLIFDADDDIHGEIQLPERVLFDEYRFKFGGSSAYTRSLLINNKRRFHFVSVLHEILVCLEQNATITTLEGDYCVISGRGGARSKNPNKYLDDARLLENAYYEAKTVDDHLYKRYSFYCANSYKDAGRFEDAIKWYKTTLTQDNWTQEKYMCCLSLYDCYANIDQKETGMFYLVESFKYDKERAECLNHLITHYTCNGQPDVAYQYFVLTKNLWAKISDHTFVPESKLFASTSEIYFYVPYMMIIIADKMNDYATGIQMFEIIFDRKVSIFSDFHIRNLLFNLQFYLEWTTPAFFKKMESYLTFLNKNEYILTGIDDLLVRYQSSYGVNTELILPPRKKPTIIEECKTSKNILIFTGFCDVWWNKTYMREHSLGGSEKAVIYIADELAARGWTVYVSGCVGDEVADSGVIYIHMDKLKTTSIVFHTVILSRYLFFLEQFRDIQYHKLYIWAHDTYLLPYGTNFDKAPDIIARRHHLVDGCVCLTEWHKQLYQESYPELLGKIRVINNGIIPEHIRAGQQSIQKRRNSFIYTSCADRGLNILLELWPSILLEFPDATLTISSYNTFPKTENDKILAEIIAQFPSIRHLGRLAPNNLYSELRSAEFWLYTCTFKETSCITAMEMLAAEVVCLYYPLAGLPYTMGECGVQVERGNELATLRSLTEERKAEMRVQGLKYVLDKCLWGNRADEWVSKILC